MARKFKHSLKLSLVAATLLSASLAQSQSYDAYPEWGQGQGYGGYPWAAPAEQNAQAAPAALLRDGVQKLTRFLDSRPDRGALTAYLDRVVAPWFDFNYMAQWAAGRRFNRLNDAQQAELVTRIKTSFLEKMAQKLARYSQQRAMFMPLRQDDYDEVTLPVAIENPDGYPAQLEFVMRRTNRGWKVVDVSANGMSALVFYRQMVNEMLMNSEMMNSRQQMMAPPMRPY